MFECLPMMGALRRAKSGYDQSADEPKSGREEWQWEWDGDRQRPKGSKWNGAADEDDFGSGWLSPRPSPNSLRPRRPALAPGHLDANQAGVPRSSVDRKHFSGIMAGVECSQKCLQNVRKSVHEIVGMMGNVVSKLLRRLVIRKSVKILHTTFVSLRYFD